MTSMKSSLTSIIILTLYINTYNVCGFQRLLNVLSNSSAPEEDFCPPFDRIENGNVTIKDSEFEPMIALVTCDDGFRLEGTGVIKCVKGHWKIDIFPTCTDKCATPPYLRNGAVEIDGKKDGGGLFYKGALATYTCIEGYTLFPNESRYRVCERGSWTGPIANCLYSSKHGCPQPKDIRDGYYVSEKRDTRDYDMFALGQRLHYSCKPGFTLVGSPVQQCLDDGTWSPKIQPFCTYQMNDNVNCRLLNIPNSDSSLIQGFQSDDSATPGTILEVRCAVHYRNAEAPCQPAKLTCLGGRWLGTHPNCAPAVGCYSPPVVEHATQINLEAPYESDILPTLYPIKSQVSYQCSPGYILEGNQVLTCTSSSCWFPSVPPRCVPGGSYYVEVNNSLNAMLISAATGAGVLGILMLICLVVVCRKRKPLARAVPIPAPVQRPDLGDHSALLHQQDRLALIAFADGIQNGNSSLPSYEEATRERGPGITVNRLQRPHWPNLVGRRTRNSPNPDTMHVTRHGSFASHTPSTRSAGDSMGSTDTVAISEGSTNITLDTASSHSGSQPASCRVHCGSLASFDTGSVVNTEGVPLLEESELEEIHGGDNVSLVVENPSLSDTASFKYSTHSADIA